MRRFHGRLSTIGNFSREDAHEKAYASGVRYNFQRDSLTIKRIGGEKPSTRTSEIREEIQSPVSFSLTHRGFSTPTTRELGGSPRPEGDGRENWKNTSFDFAVYPRRGMETTAVEAFLPFAWSPKRLFAGRTGPVPPTFSEKYGISVER